jgi:hypothetical protein
MTQASRKFVHHYAGVAIVVGLLSTFGTWTPNAARSRAGEQQPSAPASWASHVRLRGRGHLRVRHRRPGRPHSECGRDFYEPPTAVHSVSRNPSTDKHTKIIVFMVADQKNPEHGYRVSAP